MAVSETEGESYEFDLRDETDPVDKWRADKHQELTKSALAKLFVRAFVALVFLLVGFGIFVITVNGQRPELAEQMLLGIMKPYLETLSKFLGPIFFAVLGFIFGYYFKEKHGTA